MFGLLAHAETAFRLWLRFGGALLNDLALDPALRELAILQVDRLAARYEWEQHVPLALAVGITQQQIDALERSDLDGFDDLSRAVLSYVAAFVAGEVDDSTHAAVAVHLPDREVVELALVAGHYLMLARMMAALRIDSDPAAGRPLSLVCAGHIRWQRQDSTSARQARALSGTCGRRPRATVVGPQRLHSLLTGCGAAW